ncbi:patronin isoform X35 [Drosophila busckii]|uniref:patronin isoform X35 n=1 Tax=Drosophila busckii TaxID=30019 RepID=UPI00083EDB1F|nr:patronin isoform X35 [Drosophila busckii]
MDAETQEIRQARQRASVKWLLSKAFNNRVPDNLKEPFYRDHENQERLKPQIVVELGNATLYCQTLTNLYSDPNYQSLNHWSILQTLARKGTPVAEPSDMPITETVLIQTNPLRINAHMSVIESLMVLYAKEISSGDRVMAAIRRISGSNYQLAQAQSYEQGLLAWISHACAALKKRIVKELESTVPDEIGTRLQTPDIPPVRDFQDLCDGICLALLISYYCPKVLPWTSVRINYLPAVEDSIHNILLVSSFSQKHLPYGVFHMTPEDVTYMRGSMKLNLVLLLTDLFNLFEIHPAKCVCYPGMDGQDVIARRSLGANEHGICHRRGLTTQPVTPIPDLRSDLDQPPVGSPSNRPPFQVPHTVALSGGGFNRRSTPPNDYQAMQSNNFDGNQAEAFVVHKSRGITTLSSMHSQQQQQQQHYSQHQQQQQQQQQQSQQEPLVPARLRQAKEKNNVESKADERGDYIAAGRPSNWEQSRRPSFAGRRSRRNSSSEDSQLTIENFGGSQDQLNTLGRFERERDRERERKLSNTSVVEPAVAIRSSIADARGTLQLGYDTDSGSEKQDRETEKYLMRRQASVDNVPSVSGHNLSNAGSPLPMARNKQHSNDKDYSAEHYNDARSSVYDVETTPVRKSSTSSMPASPAAWQLEVCDDDMRSLENASKLSTIRMKLEEKRRRIEQDKRKIEMALMRHQEKEDLESCPDVMKWETMSNESKRTPEMDAVDLDKYQESVDEMERRKEKIMLLSLQRRQQQEEAKVRKEIEAAQKREKEREKEEERARKKEEQMARRAAILEQHKLKKAIEEAEREGKTLDRSELHGKLTPQSSSASVSRRPTRVMRPRPKTIHVDDASVDISEASSLSSRGKKGSNSNLTGYGQLSSNTMKRDYYRGSQDSLTVKESPDDYPSTSSTPIGRRGSYKTSREPAVERGRTLSRISVAKGSTLNFRGRKSNSLMNLCDTDSGLGRATPPRRAPSPGMGASGRHMPSPSGPGSLPPGLISKRRGFDDGSSLNSLTANAFNMDYSGPKLYKQPAAKSNRGIILNAVEYCVFPGAVNREAKQKVLEKIARSEAKHFLVLFRDAGCQFRALYSYVPETNLVTKLYGTGPAQVDDVMFDKFFKYNSGGKCFSQIHTKHLTVTIDAFTIHNSLWQGKRTQLPSKKDMALVI